MVDITDCDRTVIELSLNTSILIELEVYLLDLTIWVKAKMTYITEIHIKCHDIDLFEM